jgi:hypothetical protein
MYRDQQTLNNHQIMFVINIYLKFMPKVIREMVLKEMVAEKILIRLSRDKMKIKNLNQSSKIDRIFSERMNLLLEEERKKSFWFNHGETNEEQI